MEKLEYNLMTRRMLQIPRVWYSDKPETWELVFSGRPPRPAVRWRGVIATARSIDDHTIVARINDGIEQSGGTLSIPVDVFFVPFRDAVATYSTGRDLYLALYALDEAGLTVEYIDFKIMGFPAIDPPDGPPKDLPDRPGGGGSFGGLYPDNNPVADLPFGDPDYGMCHYLDATFPSVSFTWPVYRLRKITALIRSANPAITGSIVLTPLIDGEVRPSVSVAVGANWTEMDIPLTVETGEVTLRRDVGGTLNDGGMVTAILRCITAWGEL